MFVSVDGKARKVVEIFAGSSNGKACRVTELFGSVNGIARLLFSAEPPATNGFDAFTWAEIKQLANEGKLLEHFNVYDRVTVQLKTPLVKEQLGFYLDNVSKQVYADQKQTEMVFQIVELTETKMRLMCPRVNVLGTTRFDMPNGSSSNISDRGKQYSSDFANNKNYARTYFKDAWGFTKAYDDMKIIQNALPDDLLDVLSIVGRPLITWEKDAITGSLTRGYDEDLKVRQLTTNKLSKSIRKGEDGVNYPVINESYFPTTITDYLYHIKLPEEYDTYESRKAIVKRAYSGFTILKNCRLTSTSSTSSTSYYISYCKAPEISCAYSRGFTTTTEYNEYSAGGAGQIVEDVNNGALPYDCYVLFPEIIIEADA